MGRRTISTPAGLADMSKFEKLHELRCQCDNRIAFWAITTCISIEIGDDHTDAKTYLVKAISRAEKASE